VLERERESDCVCDCVRVVLCARARVRVRVCARACARARVLRAYAWHQETLLMAHYWLFLPFCNWCWLFPVACREEWGVRLGNGRSNGCN